MRKVAALTSGFLLVVFAAPSLAQTPDEKWHVTIAPYMLGAAMNGTSAVAGQELKVDMSFSDILSNLQFGAMGLVVARKGNWGFGGDAIWMASGRAGPHQVRSASPEPPT